MIRLPATPLKFCMFVDASRRLGAGAAACCLLVILIAALGCKSSPRSVGPYSPIIEAERNTALADRLNQQAADVIESDPKQAERLLREALTADLYFGPAHNNLGILFLQQEKLYEAANEFEWAKKLLPGHPDPRMNLALVLETAGRNDEALAMYTTALEVYPDHLPSMQGLVRLQIRTSQRDDRTRRYLDEIALRADSDLWRRWAKFQAARFAQ